MSSLTLILLIWHLTHIMYNIAYFICSSQCYFFVGITFRITGWQWSAAELQVRVDAVVRHYELMIQIHCEANQTGG